MKIALGSAGTNTPVDLLAVLVAEDELSSDELITELDGALDGGLRKAIKDEEFTGKRDAALAVQTLGRCPFRKVLLLGVGSAAKAGTTEVRAAAARAAKTANADKLTSLALCLRGHGEPRELRAAVEGVTVGAYRFTKYFTGDRRPKKELDRAVIAWRGAREHPKPNAEQKRALAHGEAVGGAINLTRDLVNEPPNELTPARLADAAVAVAKAHGLTVKVFDQAKIRAEGMHLQIGRAHV